MKLKEIKQVKYKVGISCKEVVKIVKIKYVEYLVGGRQQYQGR